MAATATPAAVTGKVVQVIGPVLDVEFEADHLPELYNALNINETLPDGTFYDTIDNGYRQCFRDEPCADDFAAITVPAGHVFLMGDNRDNSSDGRFPAGDPYKGLGGPVPLENLGGRAEFITFSLDGSASWYNPISWFTSMRSGRAGTSLRPGHTTPPARAPSEPAAAR